ncbi:uncharacterized protein LOC127245110 isoform X2 [Andrographis paniculata]|uniref:uncharacterized protein LOC127245110 isoform X2 n=1 Tax=Andrographis paniculata TaxID=175694 RepID=UPI0021E9891A|nr:uncharacterized protein LOC127245110 isoform X2 [Andrographis paniculata]
MGREWLHWGSGGGGGGRHRRRRTTTMAPEETTPPGGCICAVFHLFDLQPFQLPLNQSHLQQQQPTSSPKGIEAPRNSLESDIIHQEVEPPSLNFPGGLQIKTRVSSSTKSGTDQENCSSSSPGTASSTTTTTTPSLVARLMGLDILPQSTSPSYSSNPKNFNLTKTKKDRHHQILGRRLPSRSFSDDDIIRNTDTPPRMSAGRRRSDVECHRLSLKENLMSEEEFGFGKRRLQILSEVRESLGRRRGGGGLIDITNRIRMDSSDQNLIRRDENLVLLKPCKKKQDQGGDSKSKLVDQGKLPLAVRFSDIKKNKQGSSSSGPKSTRIPISCHEGIYDPSSSNNNQDIILQQGNRKGNGRGRIPSSNLKKFPHDWSNKAMMNKKEEPFVRSRAPTHNSSKFKKSPLSMELLNTSGPTLLSVKKSTPSPQKQMQMQTQIQAESDARGSKRNTQSLSSKKRYSYDLQQPGNGVPDSNNSCCAAAAADYRCYIQRILKRTGIIDGVTPLKLGKWHTPSHPLDPSIFYYLELFHPVSDASSAALSRRCNRKLVFQLVDELLAEILKPYLEFQPRSSRISISDQIGLIDELYAKIDSFPAANCQFLEDIDALIDKDLRNRKSGGFPEEERAKLAGEIAGEIMDSLLDETASFGVRTEELQRQERRDVTWAFT